MTLVLRKFLEHRQLIRLLEAPEPNTHRSRFWRNDHHRAVGPVGRGNCRDAVADPWTVLPNHDPVAA